MKKGEPKRFTLFFARVEFWICQQTTLASITRFHAPTQQAGPKLVPKSNTS